MKKIVLGLAAASALPLFAKIQLGAPFSKGAVLQRDREVPVWGKAEAGKAVAVAFADAEVETIAGADGRWFVKLPAMAASKEGRVLTVTESEPGWFGSETDRVQVGDVLVGEVWMCAGQSNAELPIWGKSPRFRDGQGAMIVQMTDKPFVRLVKTPRGSSSKPLLDIPVKWLKMTPALLDLHRAGVTLPSAMGYYFALDLANALDVPVGIVDSSFGGANIDSWTPRCGYEGIDELKDVAALPLLDGAAFGEARRNGVYKGKAVYDWAGQQPTAMWNAMAAAYAPMAIRGVIWYQGCQNVGEAERYCAKMHALYNGWAKAFENPSLPFYFAQLAPCGSERTVQLQLAQAKFAAEEKNAAIAVINDVGNNSDIHPNDKRTVAKRLVLHALKRDYGWSNIRSESPVFRSLKVEGDTMTLAFDNVEEFYLYNPEHGDRKTGFELAGEDGVFRPAEVKNFRMTPHWKTKKPMFYGHFDGPTIVLSAPGVPAPTQVRYLHRSPWFGGIYNEVCLPLGPFAASR